MDALPMFKQEMHAMEWSKGLMQASYAAIKRKLGLAKGDRPPVDIPSLLFVWCALFIADTPPPGEPRRLDGGVYLIEELLDANQYYKYKYQALNKLHRFRKEACRSLNMLV